jgi:hypothetical protein
MQDFSLPHSLQTGFGPTHLLIEWVLGAISPGVKREGREVDHSSSSTAEVKKGGAIPPRSFIFME